MEPSTAGDPHKPTISAPLQRWSLRPSGTEAVDINYHGLNSLGGTLGYLMKAYRSQIARAQSHHPKTQKA